MMDFSVQRGTTAWNTSISSFFSKRSYTERPRLCFPVFSSLSSLLPLAHYICIMYYLVSGTPATYRDVFDILSAPRMTPLTLARSSNLNNWVIDFRALVRRVYLNTISDFNSLVRPHFRWIVLWFYTFCAWIW